jgi:peptide/nickel transport system permease protein
MKRFLVRRFGQAVVTILGVLTLVFFLQRLTGDPVYLLLPDAATQEDIDALRHALGFDRPLVVQYFSFIADFVRLDLGRSVAQKLPVTTILASRIPFTLAVAGGALLVAGGLGLTIGGLLGAFHRHPLALPLGWFVVAAQSMPTFWSGILLILVFAVGLGWLPPSSSGGPEHLIMPALALGLFSLANFARVTRNSVVEELSRQYVRTARARGVPPRRILLRHVARNAAIPVITVAGLEISNLFAGAVIVETVFAWPGLGQLTMQSILARDFPIVQGVVLLGAFVTVVLNLAADILYSVVDPRIRLQAAR